MSGSETRSERAARHKGGREQAGAGQSIQREARGKRGKREQKTQARPAEAQRHKTKRERTTARYAVRHPPHPMNRECAQACTHRRTDNRAHRRRRAHTYPHGGVRARAGWGGFTNNRTRFRRELHAHLASSIHYMRTLPHGATRRTDRQPQRLQ